MGRFLEKEMFSFGTVLFGTWNEKERICMQIIENTQVKEKLYIDKLENGLSVMIIPKKGIRKKY